MLNALQPEEKLLAARCGITVESVTRRSKRLYDVEVDGLRGAYNKCSVWLPLIGIRELITWTNPHVARMSDYESMVREGDWSGIRDSSTEKIWAIFDRFVIPVLLPCGNTLQRSTAKPKLEVSTYPCATFFLPDELKKLQSVQDFLENHDVIGDKNDLFLWYNVQCIGENQGACPDELYKLVVEAAKTTGAPECYVHVKGG